MSSIIERIERDAGVPGLVKILTERLEPTDCQSLMLEVYRERARRRSPGVVLSEYETNRFVRPAITSPALLADWERTALAALPPEFEALALSPLCPLGTCSAIATVDQNRTVATARNTEVVSDATNVLALECAIRRRRGLREHGRSAPTVHLAAHHRVVRPQYTEDPRMLSHFGLFALVSAGRDRGGHAFELASLALHARSHVGAIRAFAGPAVPLRVAVTDFSGTLDRTGIEAEVCAPLRSAFEGVTCVLDDERTRARGYYRDLCFGITADTADGPIDFVDGGSVGWTSRLLSDDKERLMISGLGVERACSLRPLAKNPESS